MQARAWLPFGVPGPVLVVVAGALGGCSGESRTPASAAVAPPPSAVSPDALAALRRHALPRDAKRRSDPTNRYADDPRAAELGRKLFFEPRFSGPLLDSANNGTDGTLGRRGETGKVSCAGCHAPTSVAFVDNRSPRGQLSLASGWTRRKTPALLDVSELTFYFWDGRRDTAFGQIFGPIESPLELNSSRLFVAQGVARLYAQEYEAIFGSLPRELARYPELDASQAGCEKLPEHGRDEKCPRPGDDDPAVTRVVVNAGKAISAFTRRLTCGPSRFDAWLAGDSGALSTDEIAGASLFVGKAGCARCHTGPYFTDQAFHALGVPGGLVPFTGVDTTGDPGASVGLRTLAADPLSSAGPYSDGNDGRQARLPDPALLAGAFKTPGLRCVGRRSSFMHNARWRSLEDVVRFFSDGPPSTGYLGTPEIGPARLTEDEQNQLVAFLRALDGSGPDPSLLQAPVLPEQPGG